MHKIQHLYWHRLEKKISKLNIAHTNGCIESGGFVTKRQ
jgi:hypothetical protein